MLALGHDQGDVVVVRDQVGCPTYTAHLADALVRLIDTSAFGIHHIAGGGECSWFEFAEEIFRQSALEVRMMSMTTAELSRPAPRPPYSVLTTERDRGDLPAALAGGPRLVPRRANGRDMRTLVTGAAGFIGSAYVRVLLEARPDDEVVVLDKLTYAGRRENLADVEDRIEFIEGAIEDPAAVREAMDGCGLVVNFAAESHVDRSIAGQDPFAVTHVIGTGVLLEAARELGSPASSRSRPTRCTARSSRARSRRSRRSSRPRPTQPPRRPATCWCRRTSTPTGSRP